MLGESDGEEGPKRSERKRFHKKREGTKIEEVETNRTNKTRGRDKGGKEIRTLLGV